MLALTILIYIISLFYLPRFAFILTVFMIYGFLKKKNYILSQILVFIWIASPFMFEFALTSKWCFFTNLIEKINDKLYIYKLVSIGGFPQLDWGCYLTIALIFNLISILIYYISKYIKKYISKNKKIIKSLSRG